MILFFLISSNELSKNLYQVFEIEYMEKRIKTIISGNWQHILTLPSISDRINKWLSIIDIFYSNPIFGGGSRRATLGTSTDNFYLYILGRYGIVGLTMFSTIWFFILFKVRQFYKATKKSKYLKTESVIVFFQTLIILVSNLTIEAQIIIPISYLYFITLGVMFEKEKRFSEIK